MLIYLILFIFLSIMLLFCFIFAAVKHLNILIMVTQTSISLKVDSFELQRLDSLCKSLGCKRNKLINFAIHMINENMSCNPCDVTLVSVYNDAAKYILL